MSDRYGRDVLSSGRTHQRPKTQQVEVKRGMVVEEVQTGYVGAIVKLEKTNGGFLIHLEDRHGRTQAFPLGFGYLLEGRPVELVRPRPTAQKQPGRTASGSRAVQTKARVARGSRIWVEGKHDAELVEKIWGDDLRVEGVVVEPLGGLDDLMEALVEFQPDAEHRVGVLADHLIEGTKETRIVSEVAKQTWAEHVRVTGHPYVDIWQAVKPSAVGIAEWPQVPRGEDWKLGVLRRIGWPHADHTDTARAWQRILGSVRSIGDVDWTLSGRVEELIDFVTVGRH